MSFHLRSWLDALKVRLSGKRRGPTDRMTRRQDKRRRRGARPFLEALEPRLAPVSGPMSFAPGAYIVDMGQPTQTVGNALKPYGLVYDLVTNYKVPVDWAINPAKTTYAFNSPASSVDFTATITTGTKSYSGGSFIIDAGFLTPAVIADINSWKAQGVVVDQLAAPLTTNIFGQITSFPRAVLDSQNGALAVPYYTNAGVPSSSYVIGNPTNLTTCQDVYILPHADPNQWPVLWQQDLYNFVVNTGGGLWVGCHAGSVLSSIVLPGGAQLDFLSNSALVPFGSHSAGTPPYTYNPAAASTGIMQIMNNLDAATQNGSEQIYVPTSTDWRSTTTVAVYDPDNPSNPPGGTSPFNDAAVLAFGNAFGNPSDGLVMYEAGHSLAGNGPANIAAQRAFFNFLLTEGINRAPQPTINPIPNIQAGKPVTVTATITGGDGNYNYQWVSTNGGVFSVPAGTATAGSTITTQYLLTKPTDTIRLVVTDTPCGRQGIASVNVAVPPPTIDLDADNSSGATGADYQGTFSGGAIVPAADTDTVITDNGSTTISSAAIKLTTRPDGTAETLLINQALAASDGITVTSDGNGGFILTGTATLAQYDAVIASLQYTDSLAFPNTQQRVIDVTVNDGLNNSNTAVSRLNFAGGAVTTVPKELYLGDPGQGMDRIDPVFNNETNTMTAAVNPVVSPNSTGMALWTNTATQNLVYDPWKLTAFGTPAVQITDGANYITMTSAASTKRNEAIMVGLTKDNHISGAVWNGTAWTPIAISIGGKTTQNLGKPSQNQFMGAAVAYETNSGRAMLVWDTGTTLNYSLWNGTSWTAAASIPAYTGATPAGQEPIQIRLASNPLAGSNEIVMVVSDKNHVDRALVWNGSSWGNLIQLDNNGGHKFTDVNVVYEQQDGRAMVVYASGTAGNVGFQIWNGASWTAGTPITPPSGSSNFAQWTAVAADPNSNRIVLGVETAGKSAWMDVWSGTAWGTATLGTSGGVSNPNNENIAVAFDDKSGNALAVYENNLTTTELEYRTFSGGAWSGPTDFYGGFPSPDNGKTTRAITLTSNPYSDQIMLMVNDDAQYLRADLWSGTSFAAPVQLQPYTGSTSVTGTTNGQPFSFFWDSYLPGSVTTTVTFTQTTPMTSPFVLPVNGAVTATIYIQVTSGALPAAPKLAATLSQAGGTIVTLPAPPTVTPLGGGFYKLVWTGTMPNNITVPTGGQISLTLTDFEATYTFNILYDSKTYPSQVQVATSTGITINSLAVYNAPFPGGSPITTTPAGQPAYVRFTVSDPFGASDITSADVVIKNSSGATVFSTTLTDSSVVASTAGSKTYELPFTPPLGDTYSVTVIAHEGTEGVTATGQTTVTATAAPDLVVTKSDGGATVNAGGTVPYTINYSNAGLANATGVVLTEFLPTGSTFDAAASTPGWTALGSGEFSFNVGSLPAGASGSVVFAVTVPIPVPAALEQLTNSVVIADDGAHGADTNPANNSASDSTPINAGPDLVVTKTDGGVSTLPGGIVLYQIAYSNIGTQNDDSVVLTENLPANTTFNSTYSSAAWDTEGGGVFTLSVGNLPVGASGTVVFAVNVASPLPGGVTQIANTVSIGDSGDSGPDLNPANNTSTDTTPIVNNPQADLQITKTDNVATVTPGNAVTYTITVTNAGPNAVTGASFTDNVPASLSGVSYTTSVSGGAAVTPGSGSGNNITGSLNVPVGGTVIYTVRGTLDPNAAGTLTNLATVLPPAGVTDPNTGNNTAVDQDAIVPVSDLAMNKSFTFTDLDHSGTITPGDQIVFALTVTNNGPNPAHNVSALDLLPTGYQFVSDDAALNGGAYAVGTGLWTIGTIGATAPNNTAVLHITAIVGPGGNYTNAASINTSDSSDPNPGNNSSSVTPPVQPKSDLSLSKTIALTKDIFGTGVISIGDQVTFTITLNNSGPNAATGVHIADPLPSGYTFVSYTASQGTYTSGTGDWNVGTVNVLSSQTLSIVATVVANQPDTAYTNAAQVSSSGSFDPTPADDKASVTPFIADLSVTKTAAIAPGGDLDNSGTLTVGDLVNFTVTVSNNGPDFATGVQLVDQLAAGFSYVSDDSNGAFDPSTGIWLVGAVAPGATQTLNITATVNATGPFTNTAQVTASQQFDPNSTPNNNVPTENDQATVTLTPGATVTDLALAKTVSNPTPNVGDTITFTITLSNNGPSPATGVTVQDSLPTGLTFVSFTASQGTYNSGTGVWTVGAVTTTTPQTLTIQARVVSPDPLTNTAALGGSNQVDSDASNNSASATETPQQADLAVAKTVSNTTPNVGDTVTFTVTLSDLGPNTATNVTVQDVLPAGLSLVSATPSQGTYTGGVWTVGTVTTATPQTLLIQARAVSAGAQTNTATISHADQFDPNTANNSANAAVGPLPVTPAMSTTPTPTTVTLGATAPPVLKDTATLSGGFLPTGTITFTLFYNGGGAPVDTETVSVNGAGNYTTPTGFTLPTTGTVTGIYQWNTSYSGDANNNAVSNANAVNEQVLVSAATPAISTTQQPATATVGGNIADRATVTGGFSPTGTVTFELFDNPNGAGTPLFTDTEPLSGGAATSNGFATTAAGTDYWVAIYNGDGNNNPVASSAAAEPVTVTPATPTITTTQQPATAIVGSIIADRATVTGGFSPTGTVTFELFNNPNGAGTPLFTDTEILSGGAATSKGFATTAAGTDYWVAIYNGDGNNNPVASSAAAEPVTITAATPAISTSQQPATATVGGNIADKATVTGGFSPTGTVTFRLFDNPNGTGTPLFTDTEPLSGGAATSKGFATAATGTDYWVATYNGDGNNNPVTSAAAAEPVVIGPSTPAISTTQQPAATTAGSTIADKATVTGGFSPTGTVTFELFNNPNGAGTPLFTDTEPLSGGAATSNGFTAAVAGTDYWVAAYNGDGNNNPVSSGTALEPVVITPAPVVINTTPNPTTVTLGTSAVTLKDSATLAGGSAPTGSITFTLFYNGGGTAVDTETVSVSGDGTYTTPNGFTLPSTGAAVTGTYQWNASYSGDANNNPASDNNAASEQVTVSNASPTIITSPNPTTVTLGPGPEILNDTATLAGGFNPTGSITFTLFYNGGATPVDTETVNVTGNGVYTTPTGYTLPRIGTVTGTYQWDATYNGDPNNNPDSDTNALNELVTVSTARPTLTTTPSPTVVTLGPGPSPILTDTADLGNGFNPNGTITFTLFYNGSPTPVDTETVAVNGNGNYTTPTGYQLPDTGVAVTGIYQWVASYSDKFGNNGPVTDANDPAERVTVAAASPTITTTADPNTATLGATLQDAADLNGYVPTGSITFRLYAPGVDPSVGPAAYTENVMPINGSGTYHTTVGFVSNATGVWHWVAAYNGDSNNNAASSAPLDEPVTIPQQADLALAKTVSNSTPNVGDTITFTVTLTDKGPDAATNVTVSDLLPSGLTLVGSTPSQGSYAGGVWTVGTVSPAAVLTLTLTAKVVSPDAQTNTATISHSDQFDPDPADNQASVTETPQQADLAVAKTVSNPTPNVGDVITFTVTLINNGPNAATGVHVSDLLPGGLSFMGATHSQGNYDSATGLWDVGALANGTVATLQIQAQVVSPSAQVNTATISAADQFDPDAGNDTGSALETPQQADLAVGKSVSNPTPNVGDTITYTVHVTNNGPDAATNVAVQDVLPAGVSYQSSTATAGVFDPTTRTWTVGTVAVAATQTLSIIATVVSPNPQTNTASISHADQFDPDTANNDDTASVTPQQADLELGKVVSDPTPNVGDTITFTVTLTDNGPNIATNVQVTDLLPAGLAFVSAAPSQGTYVAATGIWTVGTVTMAAPQTLTIQARVVGPAARTNTASITHADQFDPDPGNDSASATETPLQADLAVTKSVSNPTPNVGDTITFTVALTDLGPDAATGVTVADLLPAGLSLVSFTPSRGTYTPATGVWDVGVIDPSAAQTLILAARVDSPAAATNTASVSHSDQFDPNAANNTAAATETPQQADLAVGKSVSNATPNVGDTVTFTVTLTNKGPNAATDVQLTDLLPAGLTFVASTETQGTYNSTTGLWTVGQVDAAARATLTLQARVVSAAAQTNTASVSHSDQFDPNAGNNTASAAEAPQQADLQVGKTVSNARPNVGDTITFTVTLTDIGPDPAANVTVQDLLPAGLTFVSDAPSQGSYDSALGQWTVGTVDTSGARTLTLTARVVSPGAQTNTASVSHSDQFDPNAGNNTASAAEAPQQADLQVGKTVSNARPNVGDTITFTVTLTDIGPDPAANVTVQDLLPAGLTFVSDTPSQGSYSSVSGVWTVGTVTTTTPQTLLIQATVASSGAQTNTATISHSDQFDPNTGNNSASAAETPQQADLAVSKTVSDPTPNVGDTITYTITLSDNGPDPATNVTVHDTLPAGVSFLSATPSQGAYNSTSGVWTVGTVIVGAPQTLTITAKVVGASPAANTASVSHSDQFDPDAANNSDAADTNPQHADLALAKTVSDSTPNVGETITFTVTLSDNGPNNATNVTVQDLLPAGLTFVTATASQGGYDHVSGIWTVGAVTTTTPQTLVIQATVASPAAQTNTAVVFHADQFDPDPGNNTAVATETPQQADLALIKIVSNSTPNVGDAITFTVTLVDNGPDPATGVTVDDLLPAGLSFVSASPSAGIYNSATGVWTVGTVTTTTPQTLLIRALVASSSAQTNTAIISHADQFDPDAANDTAGATETPQHADLALAKTVSDATPNVGDVIAYTISLSNHGPDAATGVTIKDVLPAGLSFVSATTSLGSYSSVTGLWTVGTLAGGAGAVLTLNARVVNPTAQTNTATVDHSDQFDPDPANNQAGATETPQRADLALAKTVSDAAPNVGDTVTFTVTLTDNGPDPATDVTVADLLPGGLTFITATPSQGTYSSATGAWVVGTVTPGAPQTLQIQARVNSPAAQTNTANVSASDQFDPDPANNQAAATETPQQADLALSKTVSDATPNVGDVITYTVTLTNNGPGAASAVAVSDPLPPGLSFVSFTASEGSYDSGTGLWTVGDVAANILETLQVQARVNSPAPQTNTAAISHSDQFDPDPGNNSAGATETPQQADLALSKTVSDATPNVGDVITFTVTLTNSGPDAATNVAVTDLLPAGLSFVAAAPSQGNYNSTTGLWTLAAVPAATPETLAIEAAVVSSGPQANTATITAADQFDPDPGNNTAGATETPQQADLQLSKTVSNPTPNVGDTITYTIILADNGPDPATGVTVQDTLPSGLSFVSAAATEGSYNSTSGVWTVGTVVVGAPQTLTITAKVVGASPAANTASVSHSDQFDPDAANNSDAADTNPQHADLALAKTVSNSHPNVGETITFTVTLTNNGFSAATGVQVSDPLPAGLSLVSATPSEGSYSPSTGLWTVGPLANGGQAVLTLQAKVVSPNGQTNTAAISHSDQFDPDAGNNTASAAETPQQADLQLNKTVSDATPNVGDTITFTVALRDLGPDAATNVTVNDLLPAGLSLVSSTPGQGGYAGGVWTVGTVSPGTPLTLILTAKVVSANAQTNTASIGHAEQFDPDPANNQAGATETPQQADLALAKTVSDATPNVGDTITFTVALANKGPDAATNVAVNDLLPAGLSFVTATPSLGSYNNGTGLWSVGTLAGGSAATLTIAARVASPGAETNTATIGHSDQFDPNAADNTSSATETPQQADLALAKTVSNAAPNVGDTITYTVTLTDQGPDPATNVQVTDLLPPGLNLIGATPSQGAYNAVTGVWTVGTVNPSAPQTLRLQAQVVSPNGQTNTATVSHADQFDANSGNNQAGATETPQQADLALSKTVSDATPNVGDTITFTITLTDRGPDAATGVVVTDLLPAGLSFVGDSTSQGMYTGSTGLWDVGDVVNGAQAVLTIRAKVVSPNAQTNTATISGADQFDPDLGNNSAAAGETPQQADLVVGKSVSDPTPNVGDTITYTVRVTNDGPDAATGVTLQDILPHEVSFQGSTASEGSYDHISNTWTVGTVGAGVTETLIITVQVISPDPAANTASISHADQFDPNTANNSNTASIVPQQADLALAKTVSNSHPNVGDTVTFTVTLTNNGFAAATEVQVTDLLPAGLSFVGDSTSQGMYTGSTGLWDVGDVANGAQAVLTIRAKVVSPNAQTNTATISGADQFDPDTGNNSAAATETPQRADLALSKTVSDATPNVGDTITFTVALADLGPDAATDVTVQDLLPLGLTLLSFNPSRGTYTPGAGIWDVGPVDPSAAQTLTLTARVDSPNSLTNTATVSHTDQFDPDSTNNSASAAETPQHADLAVGKTVSDSTPNVGDTITFTLTVSNAGPDAATNVSVNDLLPAGLGFVSDTPSQGNYNSMTGLWTVNTLAPSTTATLQIEALVVSSDPRTNTATIHHSDQFDPNTGNNSGSAAETPQHADLAMSKSVSDATPNVGDTITFTVTVSNSGPDAATNVSVNDLLPAGLGFVADAPSQGNYNSATGLWAVNTVGPFTTATLQIEARVVSPDAQTNVATIGHADQFDPATNNNMGTATETPQQADLALSKSVNDPTPNVGDTITFNVTLTNSGPDAATGVTVEDALPAGLTFLGATPSQGNYDHLTGLWTVGGVAAHASPTLQIQARVDSPIPLTNTAAVDHADQFDPHTANNTAGAVETPQVADLAVAKTVSNAHPNLGDTITFTVALTNNGPSDATAVQVTDLLPAGLSLVSETTSQGNYAAATGVWSVGSLADMATATLTLSAKVASPNAQTNTATITGADQFDPDPGNNSAGAAETPLLADLVLSKTVSNAAPSVSDAVTFVVTLANNGPGNGTNVQVNDPLPAGLTFLAAAPSQGTYDPATGLWTAGTVTPTAPLTLAITARVASINAQTNTATITHADQFDPHPGNNSASATETPNLGRLILTKTVNDAQPLIGEVVAYTFTLVNAGPGLALNVAVYDPLPAGVTFVGPSFASLGTFDPTTDVWNVGTLVAGGEAVLQLPAVVQAPGPQANIAVASAVNIDPTLSDLVSAASLTAFLPAGIISKRDFLSESGGAPGASALPPSVRTAFGPAGEVVEVVSADGVLTQFDAAGAHLMGAGVRSASVAFDASGSEVLLATLLDGTLIRGDRTGAHVLGSGVLDAQVAFGPQGEVTDVVFTNGVLYQFDAAGAHLMGAGVRSASVAFDASGSEVLLATLADGTLIRGDRTGAHVLGSGVLDAQVAFGPDGGEVIDLVFQDDSLWQFDGLGAHALGMIL